ncbi:hypothetical protein FHT77_004856 [Rhizobium sp. BK181]|uniref:DUF3631 domain-containing protein n=1 Tax=Rhizobium sp. BK181 TaxID=2587072 RepID=UPI0016086BE5|nr:DUF3631 domain-containing protein [Rhizobium sp. BK181]MBB3318947.1 hypothetical protein [Rhizobium sp. BK181]
MTKPNGASRPLIGAALLDDIEAFLGRFIAYPNDAARVAHALWCAHCHLMDCWESTPRIAFLSPEPGSGKTRCLEVTELLVPRPVTAINCSSAYLFRKVADKAGLPTILFDEVDTLFGPKAREHEEVRALINAGHRRGAVAGRCVVKGKRVEIEELPAYAAVAVAGLGDLPDTILTRSVVVNMLRRRRDEPIEPYRRRAQAPEGEALRKRLEDWGKASAPALARYVPEMPEGVTDRNADVWEALIAIADVAGGRWPELARVSCVTLVSAAMGDKHKISLPLRLLSDIRDIFIEREALGSEYHFNISTAHLIEKLVDISEAPWGEMKGKPITPLRLSRLLRKHNVQSKQVRVSKDTTLKGYQRDDFHDAWERNLPPLCLSPIENETSETSGTPGSMAVSGAVRDLLNGGVQ